MRKRLKSIMMALALVGVSVTITLGMAEGSLRLLPELMPEEAQLRLHWREVDGNAVPEAHPYLGYVYPSNHDGWEGRPGGDFSFTYTTDEHGFRNPSPWPERAEIVVLGDSMAFGYGVDDEEAWTTLLANQLPSSRIINLGLIGAAPQQYLRIYETFGQALRPALVIFCLFPGNDLHDAESFYEWLRAGSPRSYAVWRQRPGRWLLRQSYLMTFLYNVRDRMEADFNNRTIDFEDGGQLQLAPTVYARGQHMAQPDHPNFRLVLDAVQQTRALAEQNGSQFLVLVMPTKEEVYLPLLNERPPPATSPFVAQFEKGGVRYLDLTPHLQASAREGERLFFEVDGHPNAAGYRRISEAVLDYLRNSG